MIKILKLGGSVITKKESEIPKIKYSVLDRVAREIAEVYKEIDSKFIIIHGVGSYGHPIVKRTGIDKGITEDKQLLDFSETQRLQNELNVIVTKVFREKGIPAMPIQASAMAVMDKRKLIHMDISAIRGFLDIGMVPVLYGVPAYDKYQKCSILSGDEIAAYLGRKLKVKKIIHGTDVDGIFTEDPKLNKNAKLIPLINKDNFEDIKKGLSNSTHIDVTGGMLNKVEKIIDLVKEGIEVQFVNALVEYNIKKALMDKKIGTLMKW